MEIAKVSISEAVTAIKNKTISSEEVTKYFLGRIEKSNSAVNAFITVNENSLEQARAIDSKISKGENPGLLAGIPIGIKDMICAAGLRTTAGSRMLSNFTSPYDATIVENLKKNGSVILGKQNQDEFAMGSSNETSFFGPSRNPWNLECVPGGSSGGSAAAQAARLCMASVGTDTGGSVRQPANFCNVVGFKPTYGRISRFGVIAYASSLDQAGPMTSSVNDAALMLQVLSGYDEKDSTTSSEKVPNYTHNLSKNIKGLRIGLIKEHLSDGLDAEVRATLNKAIETLKNLGCEVKEVSLPLSQYAIPVYYLIAASEASSNLSRYDGVKFGHRAQFENLAKISLEEFYQKTRGEGFGEEVKRRIMLGTYCLSSGYFDAYYKKACQVRRLLYNQYAMCFESCDVVLTPVTSSPAFKIGDKISDPLAMYLNDIFTVTTNLVGAPGMSLPYGFSTKGLPIGIQLLGRQFDEQTLLNVGLALEETTEASGRFIDV